MRTEGNFLPKQKIPFYKKIFSRRKSSVISNFELHISNLYNTYFPFCIISLCPPKVVFCKKYKTKKLPIHKGTRRLAVPPLFKTNVLHSFALTQHHVPLNVQTYFSQKAPALKFSPAPYKSTYSRWCFLSWEGVTKLTYTHSSPLCYDDTI